MERRIIIDLLDVALKDFYRFEKRNLELDVHEITHGHRLAYYMEKAIRKYDNENRCREFWEYSVDLEFNRTEGGNSKIVLQDGLYRKTRCDILLHSKGRNKTQENLLIIELKKGDKTNKVDDDLKEISRMVSPPEENAQDTKICGTLLGVFLRIYPDRYSGTRFWYQSGKVCSENF